MFCVRSLDDNVVGKVGEGNDQVGLTDFVSNRPYVVSFFYPLPSLCGMLLVSATHVPPSGLGRGQSTP